MSILRGSYILDAVERSILLRLPDAKQPFDNGELTQHQQDCGVNALELLVRRAYPNFDITKEMHNKHWVACGYEWIGGRVSVVYRHDFTWYLYKVPREELRKLVYGFSTEEFDTAVKLLPTL